MMETPKTALHRFLPTLQALMVRYGAGCFKQERRGGKLGLARP
ncbi:hypothetical protein [Moorena sp. SIO4G3]|nr:hypothetical protein [Moorena sp. SIO4G3]